MSKNVRRKITKIAAYGAAGFAGFLFLVLTGVVLFLQGERLAALVNGVLPAQQGKLHFGSITFRARLLYDLIADRPTPMVVDGLRITDPEGTVVLDVPHLTVSVRLQTLITGGGIILSDLNVGPNSVWRFAKMKEKKGIGFLTAFDPKNPAPPPPPKPPGAPKEKGFVFQIVNAQLDGFRAIFDFPGVWGLDLRDIHAPASVLVDGEGFVGFDVTSLDARQGGYLRVMSETLPFDKVWVNRVATTREWSDDIFLDLPSARTGQTTLSGKGFFTGIYGAKPAGGIQIHAEFENAVDALTAVAKPHGIVGLRLSGDQAKVVADLWDTYDVLKIKAEISHLDAAYEAYQANNLAVRAGLEFSPTDPTLTLKLEELSFASPEGGTFSTKLTMAGDRVSANLRFDEFKTGGYLPAGLKKLAAGTLRGGMAIAANLGEKKSVALSELDLSYSCRKDNLPGSIRLVGGASASPEEISTRKLRIEIPGAGAEIRGKVDLAKQVIGLALKLSTTNLPAVLARVGAPPIARSAEAEIAIAGSMDSPTADGHASVSDIGGGSSGIPKVDKLSTRFQFANGNFDLDSLRLRVASGSVEGSGSARLFEKSIGQMLAAPLVNFRLEGKDISLAELIEGGLIAGKISFQLDASGTTKTPKIHFTLPSGTQVSVFGQDWTLGGIDLEADKNELQVKLCRVSHPMGGKISIVGHLGFSKQAPPMSWTIRVSDMPIPTLLATAGVAAPVTGNLFVDLEATGFLPSPRIAGTIRLADVTAADIKLGDARFMLSPNGSNGIQLEGDLFGRMGLTASATLLPMGVEAQAELAFDNLHVEELLPELSNEGVRTSLSGKVQVNLKPGKSPAILVQLPTVEASVVREVEQATGEQKQETLWVKNGTPLHVSVDDGDIVLLPFRLQTQAGAFTLSGKLHEPPKGAATSPTLEARLSGQIDLELLQPFLRGQLSALGGAMVVEAVAEGTIAAPAVNGTVLIARPIRATPAGMDVPIRVPSGSIHLSPNAIELTNLALEIDGSTLRMGGKVGLANGFSPNTLGLKVQGNVSARLLETLAPGAVSDVSGNASILAEVKGTVTKPEVSAKISLGAVQMRLRGLQGQVEVEDGKIELTTKELLLRNIRLRVANEGLLSIGEVRPGRIRLASLTPEFKWQDIDVPIHGERLAYRDGNIEIDNLSFDVGVSGTPEDGLELAGDLRLISGRYLQDFNIRNLVLSPNRINESDSTPVWKDQPLLENLALSLRVRTVGDSFIVQNNLAPEIHVLVDLGIGGTLSVPTLSGEIRPTDGRFHILGLRGDFELTPNVNYVTFVPTKSIARGDTPELNLQAQNLLVDAYGVQRTVIMRINGPIGQATIDLSTADGMDRNQAMLLLLSGRTTEAFSGNTGPIFGMNRDSTVSMIGQASRDAVGNLIEPYIDDTLQMLTGRKLNLRPTVGADGFEIRVQARTSREFDLDLSYLQGFQSQKRYRATGKIWISDYVTGRAIGDRSTYALQQGIQQQMSNFRLEFRVEWPIRFSMP